MYRVGTSTATHQRCLMLSSIWVLLCIASVLVLKIEAFQSSLSQNLRINPEQEHHQIHHKHQQHQQQFVRPHRTAIVPLGIRPNDDCDLAPRKAVAGEIWLDGSISRRSFAASMTANMATATLLFPTLAIADEEEDDDDDDELVSDEEEDEDDTPVSMVEYFIKDFSVSLPDNWKILTEFDKDESGTSKGASYPTLFSATDVRTGSILTVVQEEACGLQDYSKSKEAGSPLVCDFVQPKEGAPPLFSTETYARDATQLLIRHDDREKANSASVGGSSISKLVDTNLIGYGSSYAKGMDSTMTSATYFETRSAVLDLEATTTTISLEEAAPIERRVLAKAVATTTTITKTTEVTKEAKAAASPEESTKQSPQEPALDIPAEKSPAPSESPPSSKTESGGVQDFSAGTLASPDRAAKSDASLPTATTMPSSTKDAEAEIKAPQTPATNIDAVATKSTVAVASSSVKNSSEQPGMSTLVTPPLNSDTTEAATAVVFVESATSAPPIPTTTTTTANAETTFAPKEENASAGTTLTAALMATVASIVTDSLPSQAAVDDSTEGFDKIPKTITAVNPSEPNTIASATSESPASTAASSDATETTDVKDTATNETPATDTKTGTSSQTQPAPQTMPDSDSASVANTDGKKTSSLSAIEEKGQPEPQKSLQTVTADAQQQSATTTNESKSSSEKDPSPPTEKSSEKSSKSESTPEAPPTESPTTTTTTTNTIRSTTVVSIWLTARIDEWETPVTGDRLNEVWESVQYNNVGKKKQNKKTSDMSQEVLGEDDTLNAQLLLMNRN